MKENHEGESGPLKLIFNYQNVFYSFFYDDESGCVHRSREYAVNYVYSGEMVLDNGQEQIHAGKGECVFIRGGLSLNPPPRETGPGPPKGGRGFLVYGREVS